MELADTQSWMVEHLPEPLLEYGPFGALRWWQWLALPSLFVFAWLLGNALSWLTRGLLSRLARRTQTRWDEIVLERLASPFAGAWALAVAYGLLPLLMLQAAVELVVQRGLRIGLFVVFFWVLWRGVDTLREVLVASSWSQAHPASLSLVPLGSRVTKVMIIAMAVVAVLSELDYPVASLVAGLGIGGLALALAAQKTVENLFGAFSIGVDQPFSEGDFVKIEDFVGTVETIGLRSTRIRTLDRTLISIPNGKLAEMRLETFAARDRIRLFAVVGVTYGTTAAQLRDILGGFEGVLRGHPKIWPDAVVVRFIAFGASSLDIEVMAWFLTADWNEFTAIRQEVLLAFMDLVEQAGSSFAFPTRTVQLVTESPLEVRTTG